jgi:glycosyltransferase involved in cell wall biosynthesis
VEDVVRVFQNVHQKIPSKLLLIGDGPERSHLEELCRTLNLCEEVRFLGKQEAVDELLAISDLFLLLLKTKVSGWQHWKQWHAKYL